MSSHGGGDGKGGDDVRRARRIPGPRSAPDDLALDAVPRPVLPSDLTDLADLTDVEDLPGAEGAAETNSPTAEAAEAAAAGPAPDPGQEPAAEPEQEQEQHQESVPRPRRRSEPPPFVLPTVPVPVVPVPETSHSALRSMLGAWALAACSAEESRAVEEHLARCLPCREEGTRLRDAVGLLHTDRSLDLDPKLRSRVIESCLERRPAGIPLPEWAAPYDAETARLDALLRDIGDAEWHAPVRLRWFEDEKPTTRKTTVAGVIAHLLAVDGIVAEALGLHSPSGDRDLPCTPTARTEAIWSKSARPATRSVRTPWRELNHTLLRTVSFAEHAVADDSVSYGSFSLSMRDSLLERAFECWVHGWDIARAVHYPYDPPAAGHLNRMVDLAARLLPGALAVRRRAGLAAPAKELVAAGSPGRSLHLEVEGRGGGDWYIPLDSPAAVGSADHAVAQIALDGVEFCELVAGHVPPVEAAVGQVGDRQAIQDVLFAAASLSRL
ncbi:maleylpyruvate isomerase N-terminal domain-containing protein [Streptomyces sp. NBC_00102]|uniref:maleylpyruvate isomerase N-terminal domain-containing protein n=1 Tax=Streptomyces sp. NBC_00102 TaxID=2975652 RepID=UPI002252CD6C|nr:maleylpyruvate isomerase N-terminal domain-containing protein [Streptomyces sp. NBC_00102]MCX5397671.1 maleylpyruvate isomerase N-terminal domain-containing protein [Streptomyces sp. NBC_00102]